LPNLVETPEDPTPSGGQQIVAANPRALKERLMLRNSRNAIRVLLLISPVIWFACVSPVQAQSAGQPLVLPVKYDEHRFFVQPVTEDGTTLNFFTDTGGALFIFKDVVDQLKLLVIKDSKGGADKVKFPKFKEGSTIPPPLASNEELSVRPVSGRGAMRTDWSGMLGHQWFASRVWTFDYLSQQLLLRAAGDVPKTEDSHRLTLGFHTNRYGLRDNNYPRIQVSIDGEILDLLFDTGASTLLTDQALAAIGDKHPAQRATSFITNSLFTKWHSRHPQWRVIENAEQGSSESMIEVPSISVAGYTVGPVWFTRRDDYNFHEYMSQWMDKRIEGALGGSGLRFFRVTVDYPHAVAVFEK
jgi:hypothetical protein